MATKATIVEQSLGDQLQERAVGLILTFSGIGNRRKVSMSDVEVDADKELLAMSKKLIDAEEFEAIQSLDGEARRYIETRALPSQLKKGIYLLPNALVTEVEEKLSEFAAKRGTLVEALLLRYSELVAESRRRLKSLFDATDYPNADYIRNAFKLSWRIIGFTTPTSLKELDRALYDRECKKAAEQWAESWKNIEQLLAWNLADLVEHLIGRLEPDEKTGKKKTFKDSAVTKIQDFLNTFDARNIGNSTELKALVDKTRVLIADVNPEQLRTSPRTRDTVAKGFEKIADLLDPMLVEKPTRAISFEED
jgi:hypothetical protein